jgi:hypothetical protein
VKPTDVEISRSLNAVSTTLRDQRPSAFDAARVQQIVNGALAGEQKIVTRATGPDSGELRLGDDDTLVAVVRLSEGKWVLERKLNAQRSGWALPQPAHAEQQG